jgi:hypothetical protein
MNAEQVVLGNLRLNNCTVSEKVWNGEEMLGTPRMCKINPGEYPAVYEVIARCRSEHGGQCFRSYGLFVLDTIPAWVWNAR